MYKLKYKETIDAQDLKTEGGGGPVHEVFAQFLEEGYIEVVKIFGGGYTFFGSLLHFY
jgi:hypothetical protein